jgi:uncharacterized protein YbjT (DUF2867 family)
MVKAASGDRTRAAPAAREPHVEQPGAPRLVLITGATGYVGGRLLEALENRNRDVRCMARRPAHVRSGRPATTEVVSGDVFDKESLRGALDGVDTAYYLVHSMGAKADFEARDREAARNFAVAAREAGVRRIIYLGGLGDDSGELSKHLGSRQEVGRILRESGVPTIEFRASIIIGSGSLSFEMIRSLVERLPVLVTPRWVRVRAQPIAVEDVIDYLTAALDLAWDGSAIFEIGGADRVSYGEIMREYAGQRGLRRIMVPVPVLTPRLSSLWLGLVTPLYARIGRKLIDGMKNPTVVRDDAALRVFAIEPMGAAAAIARALRNEDAAYARTRWSDAMSSPGIGWETANRPYGTRMVDSRSVTLNCSPDQVFSPIRRIGGDVGWYYGNLLWRIRGFLDLVVGGVGSRRGRRDPEWLIPGETVDFWRVEAVEPNELLRLRAEMKLPGRAWLQFEVEPTGTGCTLRQIALFDPVGLLGLLYWYVLLPVHSAIFAGMLRGIAREVTGGTMTLDTAST